MTFAACERDVDARALVVVCMDIPLDADEARRLLAELTPAAEHTALARALRAVVALTEILDGSDVPPSDAEIDLHLLADGAWLYSCGGEYVVRGVVRSQRDVRLFRDEGYAKRWWALDRNGRPCARPKVTP